jgi:hypothetical protein
MAGQDGERDRYGSKAFGKAGWSVEGWDNGGDAPEKSGFSFSLLEKGDDVRRSDGRSHDERPPKQSRQ